MNEAARKESLFFVGMAYTKNAEDGGIVDVLDFVAASNYARTPTTLQMETVGRRGVGVADFDLATGFASTSTPPAIPSAPLTSRTTAVEGAAGVARVLIPTRLRMPTSATPGGRARGGGG